MWTVLLQSNLFIPTLVTTTKFVILTIWLVRKPSLKKWHLIRNYAGTLLFNTSSNIYFGYLLESPHRGDSNKYPKHTFYEEIRIKHGMCCISFCSLRILYKSNFILMTISLVANAVRGRQHSFVEIDHEIFSTVILSLPLIQEGQLSVSGERMCTILVNRLED